MISRLRTLFACCMLAAVLTSCATGGYWVPPSAPPAIIPEPLYIPASLSLPSPTPALEQPTPTPQAIEILPTQLPTQTAAVVPTALIAPVSVAPTNAPVAQSPVLPTPAANPGGLAALDDAPILYYAQAADTLPTVAVRFGVDPSEITSNQPLHPTDFLNPGQLLIIPRRLGNTTSPQQLIPDSEVVFSPSTTNFNIDEFVAQAGGRLSTHQEWLKTSGTLSGAQLVLRVATENSINPRLLLALLEYHSGWVYGHPTDPQAIEFPLGYVNLREKGLYNQLIWAVNQLSVGYYAYREGRMTEVTFKDGITGRLAPDLNAGTAALQYYFAKLYDSAAWLQALDPVNGLPGLHERMFGNPWQRAQSVEPLYPPGITQPPLILPFTKDWGWSLTGGPHGAWEREGAYAALDFAPGSVEAGCVKSIAWVTAVASGMVVRSSTGLVVIDLDNDGYEQTGWVIVYLHLATEDRIAKGTQVNVGDPLGHPSCEGGMSTGTHIHIARKYNGEWVPADGPLPFNLGGWIAHAGPQAYKGSMTRGDETIIACTCSSAKTFIRRGPDDP